MAKISLNWNYLIEMLTKLHRCGLTMTTLDTWISTMNWACVFMGFTKTFQTLLLQLILYLLPLFCFKYIFIKSMWMCVCVYECLCEFATVSTWIWFCKVAFYVYMFTSSLIRYALFWHVDNLKRDKNKLFIVQKKYPKKLRSVCMFLNILDFIA